MKPPPSWASSRRSGPDLDRVWTGSGPPEGHPAAHDGTIQESWPGSSLLTSWSGNSLDGNPPFILLTEKLEKSAEPTQNQQNRQNQLSEGKNSCFSLFLLLLSRKTKSDGWMKEFPPSSSPAFKYTFPWQRSRIRNKQQQSWRRNCWVCFWSWTFSSWNSCLLLHGSTSSRTSQQVYKKHFFIRQF